MQEIAAFLGEILAPIFRDCLPVIWELFKQPESAISVESTPEQEEVTDAVNQAWDDILSEYDLPADYVDAFGVRP